MLTLEFYSLSKAANGFLFRPANGFSPKLANGFSAALAKGLLVCSLSIGINTASAATFTGSFWAEGEATINVDFSNPDPSLMTNGSPDFSAAFIEAANLWSNNSTFRYNIDTSFAVDPCQQASGSQLSGVVFSDTACGTGFQSSSTLAITRTFFSNAENIRTGVIFNTAFTWDVYNGNLTSSEDFRRVAVHELGHGLGLDHETRFPAIMAPTISNTIEVPQPDDIGGVATLYDSDNDGVGILDDNCPLNANPDQADQDQDDIGDACDTTEQNEIPEQNISDLCVPIVASNGSIALVCL